MSKALWRKLLILISFACALVIISILPNQERSSAMSKSVPHQPDSYLVLTSAQDTVQALEQIGTPPSQIEKLRPQVEQWFFVGRLVNSVLGVIILALSLSIGIALVRALRRRKMVD